MKRIITGKVVITGLLAWIGIVPWSTAQQVFYNGASVFVEPGAQIYVQGGFTNQGTGQVTHRGTITVTGNWENNASNNVFVPGDTGVVVLAGTTQAIQGTTPTHFARLTLANASVKSLNVNTQVSHRLALADCELNTGNFTLSVTNAATNAITRTTGFVATDSIGTLARATNSANTYAYPMGSSQGVTRYRPIDITPANANANTYAVGFLNYTGNNDSAFTFNAVAPACYVNDYWFHKISRPAGSSSASLRFYFDNQADSNYVGVANFQLGQWQPQSGAVLVSNASPALSTLTLSNVSSFSNRPWALTINSISTGIASVTATTVCQGSTVTLASTVNSVSYDWHVNGVSLPLAQNNTDTIQATVGGTYFVVHDNGICTDTSNVLTITVNPLPNTAITPPGALCVGGNPVTLQAATGGGTWTGTGITNAATGQFTPSVAGVGTVTVTYALTNPNTNCSNSSTAQVTVNTLPDAGFASSGAICSNGTPVTLTPNTPGGTFSGTGITNGSAGTFDPTVAGSGPASITYTISANGCQNTATQSITVNPAPVVAFGSVPSICGSSNPVTLTATPSNGTWTGPGITSASAGTFDPVAAGGPGNYTVTYAVTDANGCSGTNTLSVPVGTLPNASFTSPGILCSNGSPVTLVPTTTGGTWSGSGVGSSNGVFDPAAVSPGAIPVSYSITVNGCSNSSTQNITVNPAPVANITSIPSSVCANASPVQMLATPTGGIWTGNGVGSAGTFNPSISGVGQVQVVYALTQNGCSGSDTAIINVTPLPNASFTVQNPVCATAGAITMTPSTTGGSFSGTGVVGNTFNPSVGAGSYNVTYTVSSNGCSNSSVQTVTVETNPTASFTTSSLGNLTYGFNAAASTGATSYSWDFGDGNTGSGVNTTHTYASAGSYPVVLTVSNSCGSSVQNFTMGYATIDGKDAIVVYPNPFFATTGVDVALAQADDIAIEVYDMMGRLTGRTGNISLPSGSSRIDLGPEFFGSAAATYFVHVRNSKGDVNITQVIKLN
jgi:hypothetical protein